MKTLAMAIQTIRGAFPVKDIESVSYVKSSGTLYFSSCDGNVATVPLNEIETFFLALVDFEPKPDEPTAAGGVRG